jgi:hypothetical protein
LARADRPSQQSEIDPARTSARQQSNPGGYISVRTPAVNPEEDHHHRETPDSERENKFKKMATHKQDEITPSPPPPPPPPHIYTHTYTHTRIHTYARALTLTRTRTRTRTHTRTHTEKERDALTHERIT